MTGTNDGGSGWRGTLTWIRGLLLAAAIVGIVAGAWSTGALGDHDFGSTYDSETSDLSFVAVCGTGVTSVDITSHDITVDDDTKDWGANYSANDGTVEFVVLKYGTTFKKITVTSNTGFVHVFMDGQEFSQFDADPPMGISPSNFCGDDATGVKEESAF